MLIGALAKAGASMERPSSESPEHQQTQMTIRVHLHALHGAGPNQTTFFERARALLERVLNEQAFADRLATADYEASWQRGTDESDTQRTRAEVAQVILSGRESGTAADQAIDLEVQLRTLRRRVRGKTVLGQLPITTNYRFVNRCLDEDDPAELAAHLMHEWLHVAGFYHRGGNRARGDVAYVVGDIVYEVATEIDGAEAPIR